MNAPTLIFPDKDGYTPGSLGLELFEAAQQGHVALSDADGCAAYLKYMYGSLTRRGWKGARRIAIDLQGQAARHPDDRLVEACRAVLARTEKVAEHGTGAEAHAALAEISDLLAATLAGVRT